MERKIEDLIAIDGKKEASLLLASLDSTQRERILSELRARDPSPAELLRKGLFQSDLEL